MCLSRSHVLVTVVKGVPIKTVDAEVCDLSRATKKLFLERDGAGEILFSNAVSTTN